MTNILTDPTQRLRELIHSEIEKATTLDDKQKMFTAIAIESALTNYTLELSEAREKDNDDWLRKHFEEMDKKKNL